MIYLDSVLIVDNVRYLPKISSEAEIRPTGSTMKQWRTGLSIYVILAEFILPSHCCHFMLLGQILCVVQSILWLQANDDLYVWSILSILCL